MDLLINGEVAVKLEVAPYDGTEGHILIAFIMGTTEKSKTFHSEAPEKIQNFHSGVTDNSRDLRGSEARQIRILELTPLEFIDMLRLLGYGVIQVL